MAKAELEFFDHDRNISWRQVEDAPQGIIEKILSLDPVTGSYTRLLKFPPGMRTVETLVHDFWEEVYILRGSLSDIAKKETYIKGDVRLQTTGDEAWAVQYSRWLYNIRD